MLKPKAQGCLVNRYEYNITVHHQLFLTLRCLKRKNLETPWNLFCSLTKCNLYLLDDVDDNIWSYFWSTPSPILFPSYSLSWPCFLLMLATAANQREALKSPFHLKEEPKVEEALSPRPPSQSHSQVQPSFPATFCKDGPAGTAAATEPPGPLKPREGSPLSKNSLLSQDINMKVASELLIKLSGNSSCLWWYGIECTQLCLFCWCNTQALWYWYTRSSLKS